MLVQTDFWRGRRVLLTGHTGFKGAWLSLWLQSLGAEVIGLAPGPPTSPSLYELARVGAAMRAEAVDVRDADAVAAAVRAAGPEIVFHLAAQPLVRRAYRDPAATYAVNVMGTVNVLDAVRRAGGVAVAVVVTSDKCYAQRGELRPFVEDDPMGGEDPYAASKGCAELVTHSYRSSFFAGADATRIASARAGNVIGGGDWAEDRLVPDMVKAVTARQPLAVRNPGSIRPWQHVLNPLSGYLVLAQALWDSPAAATGWNFGPDTQDAQTVGWIAERLTALWPDGASWQAVGSATDPPEAGYLTLDSRRARERLGWRPRWRLEQALERIVEWHVAHLRGEDPRAVTLAQIEAFQS